MAQKTGRVSVEIDGNTLASKPGASMRLGGRRRTTEMSDQGSHYYTETEEASQVVCTLIHTAETDLVSIQDFIGTVTFVTDTKKRYVINDAVCEQIGSLENGEVEVTFGGPPAEQS